MLAAGCGVRGTVRVLAACLGQVLPMPDAHLWTVGMRNVLTHHAGAAAEEASDSQARIKQLREELLGLLGPQKLDR